MYKNFLKFQILYIYNIYQYILYRIEDLTITILQLNFHIARILKNM